MPEEYRQEPPPKVELAELTDVLDAHKILVSSIPVLPRSLTPDTLLGFFQEEGERMFGKRSPPSTMIHELEHAWRNTSHAQGSHSEIMLKFQGEPKSYSFNDAANAMYDYILQRGLIAGLLA
jgi:hypothetical protein